MASLPIVPSIFHIESALSYSFALLLSKPIVAADEVVLILILVFIDLPSNTAKYIVS